MCSQPRDYGTDHFFRYAAGRFLFDEEVQLQERYRHFCVSTLQRAAVRAASATKYADMVKLAGGIFNEVSLRTMDSGTQIVARLPIRTLDPRNILSLRRSSLYIKNFKV